MKIILASASPRRKELLEQIGFQFSIQVSDVEEVITKTLPSAIVEELSAQKAKAVMDTVTGVEKAQALEENMATDAGELLVIGADTIVACEDQILGKPKTPEQAKEMITLLQGRTHQVYTGVTLLYRTGQGNIQQKTFYEATQVSFYPMTEEEIDTYVATGDCMDKAGAYGIQGFCARYIKGIEGDYNNVVGLPVGRLYQEARNWLPR